jgi:decaprenylphospho-beta-D-ribofuranose 2-oxidase
VSDRAPILLSGWGRTAATGAHVVRPTTADDVSAAIAAADGRGSLARGLGRSYGDAAQNAGGTVIDLTGMDRIIALDEDTGEVTAEAGLSLDTLLRFLVPLGWFVPVTPGTRYVTLGGALAADIHGKNHHRDGSFAAHVSSFELVIADGSRRQVSAALDPELFWATAGGLGLTGVVVAMTVRLIRVASAWMLVDTERLADFDSLLGALTEADRASRYSVAWVDCLAGGRHLGRGVLTKGDHAPRDAVPGSVDPLQYAPAPRLTMPSRLPSGLLNPLSVKAFNQAWYRRAARLRSAQPQQLSTFFHPLDGIRHWNRVYGRRGFVQYQFVVPLDRSETVRSALDLLRRADAPSFLGVLKRFGPGDAGPMSFPRPGWTLAVDVAASARDLARLLDRLDRLVLEADGAVYLAKDGRTDPEQLSLMYPGVKQFGTVRDRVDPNRRFTSDLARRLGL